MGLNFFDIIQVMGAMPQSVAGRAAVQTASLGSDFSGQVVEGHGAMRSGDEVFGVAERSLRPFIAAKTWLTALAPRGQRPEALAALPTVTLTLSAALAFGQAVHGDLLVLQSGAGGTGCAGLAALRRCGALPMVTAGSVARVANQD